MNLAPGVLGVLAAAGGDAAHGPVESAVSQGLGLLSIACVVAVLTRFVRVPYTIALVLAGLAIALTGWTTQTITHDLVLILFLPPLLFQAGLHTNINVLRRAWAPVLVLALPGVLVTTAIVAATARPFLPDGSWTLALLLGVVMAPTDPISVMATFKAAGVPEKLKTVVEGESLFNDGTAVALFTVVKAAAMGVLAGGHGAGAAEEAGEGLDVLHVAFTFARMAGLGTLIGLGLGLGAFWLLKRLNDHTLETAITIALAWGSFVLAEHPSVHASGVIAVVVAALIIGNYGKRLSMDEETRSTLTGFWDSVDFVVNSILFLLIGLELADPNLGGQERLLQGRVLGAAAAIFVALQAARALVAYPVCVSLKGYWPPGWKHVIAWAGLKGSLSIALILGLPAGPAREFMAPVAFLVVLASLLLQGISMPWLIRRVGADAPWSGSGEGSRTEH